jgi:hypothetical protein
MRSKVGSKDEEDDDEEFDDLDALGAGQAVSRGYLFVRENSTLGTLSGENRLHTYVPVCDDRKPASFVWPHNTKLLICCLFQRHKKTTKPTFKGRWFGVKQKPPGESKKTGDTHSGTVTIRFFACLHPTPVPMEVP